MTIHNPTMDPAKFARQFARIKARDAERAPRAQIASIQAETDASRVFVAFDADRVRRFRALLGSVAG